MNSLPTEKNKIPLLECQQRISNLESGSDSAGTESTAPWQSSHVIIFGNICVSTQLGVALRKKVSAPIQTHCADENWWVFLSRRFKHASIALSYKRAGTGMVRHLTSSIAGGAATTHSHNDNNPQRAIRWGLTLWYSVTYDGGLPPARNSLIVNDLQLF